ncbi:Orthopoxvirus protein of unknown function (DUF830) [Bernardetia litoralis DSM 6794]|uniref:Peptidoglycan peptidase n=1 Tax=Bernardetia litoralis (strain ATCC 23117 / DSM 6794 / NBRC 15988 / NCIMB 1366 / Fx l1 / Sio-4) TaxID=880071 RepID=I4ALN0_BERLS|nr:YiiX family permuted papain-like enzyme [Bernardetia litoralis]AFM04865.1 Orthopoxvirus protein of unknown function (DUF830) [Bernardetia litoralis DSM 6794]
MIFSKNIYFLSLFFLFLSCDSKKLQTEIITNNLKEKLDLKKEILKDSSFIKEGDIIFQTSLSSQSKAIQLATKSKYSHVGIIFKTDDNKNNFIVLEAVQPVKFTPLEDWIKRGKDSHFVIKRLKNADEVLTNEVIQKMKNRGNNWIGKNYDLYFEWSDEKIYCSELVWKIYKEVLGIEVGKLEKLSNFDLSNKIVKDKMKERYGNKISSEKLNENVISPASIFKSNELVFVK